MKGSLVNQVHPAFGMWGTKRALHLNAQEHDPVLKRNNEANEVSFWGDKKFWFDSFRLKARPASRPEGFTS